MKKVFVFSIVIFLAGFFLSAQAVYNVTKPDLSSKWAKGRTRDIIWDNKGDTVKVKLRLYNSLATAKILDIAANQNNNGTFSWKIPQSVKPGKYIVRVKNMNNTKWGDSKVFEIIMGINVEALKDHVQVKPKLTFKPPLKGFIKPVVTAAWPDPFGALQAGTRLYLKGEKFGTQKGKIFLKGNFPGGQIELIDVKWVSAKKVNGLIPQSANGQPNQTVHLVVQTSHNVLSDQWGNLGFKGREEKILTIDAVSVNCGRDSNCNVCNSFNDCGSEFTSAAGSGIAMHGFHRNNWGAVGDDVGDDIYTINLKNGWVFKSMSKVKWHRSSGDEVLSGPSPSFPTGKSSWAAKIHWKVTPNDNVEYRIKIVVEGPIGTHYK